MVLLQDKNKDKLGTLVSTSFPRVDGVGAGGVSATKIGGTGGACADRLGAIEKLMLA